MVACSIQGDVNKAEGLVEMGKPTTRHPSELLHHGARPGSQTDRRRREQRTTASGLFHTMPDLADGNLSHDDYGCVSI